MKHYRSPFDSLERKFHVFFQRPVAEEVKASEALVGQQEKLLSQEGVQPRNRLPGSWGTSAIRGFPNSSTQLQGCPDLRLGTVLL